MWGEVGLETWIAVATCVQAVAAVAIVVLTWRLARSTEQYAGAADRQLTELQAAREAAILYRLGELGLIGEGMELIDGAIVHRGTGRLVAFFPTDYEELVAHSVLQREATVFADGTIWDVRPPGARPCWGGWLNIPRLGLGAGGVVAHDPAFVAGSLRPRSEHGRWPVA